MGATGSWFRRAGDAAVNLSVPNPGAVNKPRALSATVANLRRQETALHLQALYAVKLGPHARVMLSGGPSVFNVKQDLVQSVEFNEGAGFSSIALNQVIGAEVTRTVAGFNVAADVTWPLGSHFGIGSVTRYSRATFSVDPGSATAGVSRSIEIRAGGLQIGGGVRILF